MEDSADYSNGNFDPATGADSSWAAGADAERRRRNDDKKPTSSSDAFDHRVCFEANSVLFFRQKSRSKKNKG